MRVCQLSKQSRVEAIFKTLGVTHEGSHIMAQKSQLHLIYIEDLRTPAANILKQDALSLGADLAVPKEAITCSTPFVNALLMANGKQLRALIKKEKAQPFGLKELADRLSEFILTCKDDFTIMGVINVNEDSFFHKSRFVGEEALQKMESMIAKGAGIIDVGAVSSRPGSVGISEEEELSRLKPIIDVIEQHRLHVKVPFSLDSYSPLCVEYALQRGFSIINDITALSNACVAKLIAQYQATVVLMHMKGTPQDMQEKPCYDNVVMDVDDFFKERIERAKSFGISRIILDVGIGFGKSVEHNLQLLQHHEHFLHLGYPLLVGASRKSLINAIVPSTIEERLPGTLALHLKAYEHGASIIRVHDVEEHVQALSVLKALKQTI